MIGREESVAALVSRLSRERLVTIVGAGGIGKTTVALAVAERMMAGYEDGVWLVDLAPLADPRLVPSAVATVLGLEIRAEDPLPALVAALGTSACCCCSTIASTSSTRRPAGGGDSERSAGVNILATSREPLGVAGERSTASDRSAARSRRPD